ncbi:hypothetical protein YC2023_100005 [Brassica napus]
MYFIGFLLQTHSLCISQSYKSSSNESFQSSFPILRVGDVKMLWLHRCFRFWDACNLKKKGDLIGFDMVLLDEKHIGLTLSRIYSGKVDCMSLVISMFLEATTTSSFSMYMFVLDSPKIPTLSRYGDAGKHFISEFQVSQCQQCLSDIFGELSEYQYHLIYESQSTQNVMMDK